MWENVCFDQIYVMYFLIKKDVSVIIYSERPTMTEKYLIFMCLINDIKIEHVGFPKMEIKIRNENKPFWLGITIFLHNNNIH